MKKAPHLANIIEISATSRHLWRFDLGGRDAEIVGEQDLPTTFPPKLVGKDWTDLWRRKANIAWLQGDKVFLRVIQLPAAEKAELLSMLEFQLEKLSPIPVGQIVWSAEFVPSKVENSITAIVIIAARNLIEEYLGQLEASGYQADRLDLPFLPELRRGGEDGADGPSKDGIWIYPSLEGSPQVCLVAWWFGGALQNLQMIHLLPGQDNLPAVQEQLMNIAWAGEVEGWLRFPVETHLVADEETAAAWMPPLSEWAGAPTQLHPPLSSLELASLSARRAAVMNQDGNLLPPEYPIRYRQQFVDRLWMKGLSAVLAVYLMGLFAYFVALQVLTFREYRLEQQVQGMSGSYTNALQLRERVQVLEDQLNLKYAALDSWKAASETLPAELTLTWLIFGRSGNQQSLTLQGTAPQEESSKLSDYNDAMRNVVIHEQPLFSKVTPPNSSARAAASGQSVLSWQFVCELSKVDLE